MKQLTRLLGLIILILVSSCKKDFLDDVNDKSVLLRQEYVVDLQTTGEYLSGAYILLGSELYSSGSDNVVYPELIADNIKPISGSTGTTPLSFQYSWSQQADNTGEFSSALNVNGLSHTLYKIISAANFVIEKSDEFQKENPARANIIKGQALAIRAFSHFALVNIFAQQYNYTSDGSHPGVVYVTNSNWTKLPNKRNTVSEVYGFIIADLTQAIQLLPVGQQSKLVFGQNAARALLARVFLFKGDFTSAKNTARTVATAVPIMTANYPANLFTSNETEALFQIAPGDFGLNDYATFFASYYFKDYIQFQATNDIAALLNEDVNDKRKVWVKAVNSAWNITKYPENVVPGIGIATGSYYPTLIRSSEMYLTAAESYAQLNRPDSAIYYLDAIRLRANPAAPSTTLNGNALLEAIYKERRKELAFEGYRMFDLLRWKKSVVRQDALMPTAALLPYPSDKAIAPIPGIDVSISGLTQNKGY